MTEVDVMVGNYTCIDWQVYELWIDGLSVGEAVAAMRGERGILAEYPGATVEMLTSDVADHYRAYAALESLLLTTGKFSDQICVQLDPATQSKWTERYYALDSKLCREMLGKKLSSRLRKDLDEITEKTGLHLKSCRRQFDNIKRVFKCVEEMPGRYVDNIRAQFCLSRALAEQYAALVFLCSYRFEVTKRKLNHLPFEAFLSVSLILIDEWMDADEREEPCLDREFLSSLRDLRALQDAEKEHRRATCALLLLQKSQAADATTTISQRFVNDVESTVFKTLTRNLLSIAQGLYNNKQIKDFYLAVVEKIVEPLKQMSTTKAEVEALLKAYTSAVVDAHVDLGIEKDVKLTFKKFMRSMTPSILALYA